MIVLLFVDLILIQNMKKQEKRNYICYILYFCVQNISIFPFDFTGGGGHGSWTVRVTSQGPDMCVRQEQWLNSFTLLLCYWHNFSVCVFVCVCVCVCVSYRYFHDVWSKTFHKLYALRSADSSEGQITRKNLCHFGKKNLKISKKISKVSKKILKSLKKS